MKCYPITESKARVYSIAYAIAAKAKATIIDRMEFDTIDSIGFTVTDRATLERIVKFMDKRAAYYKTDIHTTSCENPHDWIDIMSRDSKVFITFRT